MNSLEQLSSLLLKQIEIQNNLLELENQKKDVLINKNIEQLDEILKSEQFLVMNSESIEKRCKDLQEKIGNPEFSLKEIIEKYDPENEYFLKSRFNELFYVLTKLKKLNNINMSILNVHINMIDQFYSILGLKEDNIIYKKDGNF